MIEKIYNYNLDKIEYSIVTPVYNQEAIIVKNINSFINYTLGNFEIILILDFCSDNTEKNIVSFLNKYNNTKSNLIQITIYKTTKKPLFETKCDNIGFKMAKGKYCLEIQADMEMTELGYNLHLTKPFKILDNVIAVSGRCAHNIFRRGGVGKLGTEVCKSVKQLGIDKNTFYVYETCNRGPLLIDTKKLMELDYLDEEHYFLDNSDHDLMLRAYLQKKYICGYVPIDFLSPLENGSTRCLEKNAKDTINLNELNRLKNIMGKGFNDSYIQKYKKLWESKESVLYKMV